MNALRMGSVAFATRRNRKDQKPGKFFRVNPSRTRRGSPGALEAAPGALEAAAVELKKLLNVGRTTLAFLLVHFHKCGNDKP